MKIVNKESGGGKNNYLSLVCFFLGFGLFMFTRSTLFVPIAIVLAPTFILLFMRSQKAKRGILLTLLGFCLSITIALWGLFDVGGNNSSLILQTQRRSQLLQTLFQRSIRLHRRFSLSHHDRKRAIARESCFVTVPMGRPVIAAISAMLCPSKYRCPMSTRSWSDKRATRLNRYS